MKNVRKISDDLYYVGASDRRIALFENVYPVPSGVSYNSYLLLDESTVLFDTVDHAVAGQFFENIQAVLNGRSLDFVVVNHIEPDHSLALRDLILRYPDVTVVCNAKTVTMIRQYFGNIIDTDKKCYVVAEGDILSTGKHNFTFVMAPMVHWPEVMVTYDTTDGTLYSADAFGSFGAIDGTLFADDVKADGEYMSEMRRYYTNIVGKYGNQVKALLKKASGLDIRMICPLHGLIWREKFELMLEKYTLWSTYTPEEKAVVIAYASVYGNTQNAAEILAGELSERGVRNIKMYDVSVTHPSYIISEAFRASHLVFASTTYNSGIFVNMENLLHDIAAHNLQNRTVSIIENGTWAATSGKLMREILATMKGITVLENSVTLKSSLAEGQYESLSAMADEISASMRDEEEVTEEQIATAVEPSAMFKLTYGLFVLATKDKGKDNACIINTAMQVAENPKRLSVAVNKANLTHDMIKSSKVLTLSILSESASFEVFKRFGFQSGRATDKFEGCEDVARASNGIYYLTKYTNSYMACRVTEMIDCGTHTVFIAEITEAKVLSGEPSVTYQYYFDHIKPKPAVQEEKKKGYVCKVCGYVYEGESLPEDFICPLCKHGAEDFEKIK